MPIFIPPKIRGVKPTVKPNRMKAKKLNRQQIIQKKVTFNNSKSRNKNMVIKKLELSSKVTSNKSSSGYYYTRKNTRIQTSMNKEKTCDISIFPSKKYRICILSPLLEKGNYIKSISIKSSIKDSKDLYSIGLSETVSSKPFKTIVEAGNDKTVFSNPLLQNKVVIDKKCYLVLYTENPISDRGKLLVTTSFWKK